MDCETVCCGGPGNGVSLVEVIPRLPPVGGQARPGWLRWGGWARGWLGAALTGRGGRPRSWLDIDGALGRADLSFVAGRGGGWARGWLPVEAAAPPGRLSCWSHARLSLFGWSHVRLSLFGWSHARPSLVRLVRACAAGRLSRLGSLVPATRWSAARIARAGRVSGRRLSGRFACPGPLLVAWAHCAGRPCVRVRRMSGPVSCAVGRMSGPVAVQPVFARPAHEFKGNRDTCPRCWKAGN
jgi:hypothetical protein